MVIAQIKSVKNYVAILLGLLSFPFFYTNLYANEKELEKEKVQIRCRGSEMAHRVLWPLFEKYQAKFGILEVDESDNRQSTANGIRLLIQGKCDIALASRPPTKEEYKLALEHNVLLMPHLIGFITNSIVVNKANPVKDLSMKQLKQIYKGEITNWKEVGGKDLPIECMASFDAFNDEFLLSKLFIREKDGKAIRREGDDHVQYVGSAVSPVGHVSQKPNRIGLELFMEMGRLADQVNVVSIDGVLPMPETVRDGKYPLAKPIFFVTNGFPKPGSTASRLIMLRTDSEVVKNFLQFAIIPLVNPSDESVGN